MTRLLIAAFVAATFAGCASDAGSFHHHASPQDPSDYHGVPTDMTPPSMVSPDPAAQ